MTKRKTPVPAKLPERRAPTPQEKRAIEAAAEHVADRRAPVEVKYLLDQAGNLAMIDSAHSDIEGHSGQLCDAFGTISLPFIRTQLIALEHGSRPRGEKPGGDKAAAINAALAIVGAVRPENELEAALAVQMASNHALTSEVLGRAKTTKSVDELQIYGNLAVKLQRTFTGQIEALARLRGKGQQTVRVEHVTVEAGAQAIVGDVHHHPGGRGSPQTQAGQSHAKVANAPIPALPSADETGDLVRLSGDGERPLSYARRHKSGRSSGE